jgi:hypothetical protein
MTITSRAEMNQLAIMEKHDFESAFWGNCANTLGEEIKQTVYAWRMGLRFSGDWRSDYNIDMRGASVIDIGGGPVSLLLKCVNVRGTVIDPLPYPAWCRDRYAAAGISFIPLRGEDLNGIPRMGPFDEAWIYNVLQHVDDPALILANARRLASVVRIFEWINIPAHPGHPHQLAEGFLAAALGGPGQTEQLNDRGCIGQCFYGVFAGKDQEDEAEQAGA